eukprot:8788847-Pyramimonas_sp.AAC.1
MGRPALLLRRLEALLEASWSIGGSPGLSCGILAAPWDPLGASWGFFGASWGPLGSVRVPRLGTLLEPSWGPLG